MDIDMGSRIVLDSRLDETRRLGPWLETALPEEALAAVRAAIELALVELVSNIIRHGFEPGASARITLALERAPDMARIAIHDSGKPVPPWAHERAGSALDFDATDLDDLPEGGIGLAIAVAAMDGFAYEEGCGGNTTRLEKMLDPAA